MDRRSFLLTAASTAAVSVVSRNAGAQTQAPSTASTGKFKLRYAPDLGAFKAHAGDDTLDAIRFAADQGFTAMFDNGLMGKTPEIQERMAKEMDRLGMTLGPFVLYADFGVKSFVTTDETIRTMLADRMKQGIETAKRSNAKWALVVPGRYDERLEWAYQTANVVENLRRCSDAVEASGLVLVIEPLNRYDHPGLFLTGIPQAYEICRAVNRPCCKIVNDLYHQQITEGNLIPNVNRAWDQIGAFHVGDNPGRKEPGTGEINYRNVFRHIHAKGYTGVLCMEHGNSKGSGKEAEKSLIAAYRAADDF